MSSEHDDLSDIAEYYNADPLHEHTRLERHQLEVDLTWRYFERYLPAHGRVLEIGAATGRYTVDLVRRGYDVTAVDLSTEELALCEQNLAAAGQAGRARLVVADARDLSVLDDLPPFDAILLMGPLYHLGLEAERKQALRQAAARLRPGGVLCSAFISRLGIIGDLMRKFPHWIESGEVRAHLDTGKRPEDAPRGGFRGYYATVGEIAPLHEALGFETLALAAVEPAISGDDESYNNLEGSRRKLWLDLLEEISTDPNSVGASRHLLYVGRLREKYGI